MSKNHTKNINILLLSYRYTKKTPEYCDLRLARLQKISTLEILAFTRILAEKSDVCAFRYIL